MQQVQVPGGGHIDFERGQWVRQSERTDLTPTELRMLRYLAQHAHRAVPQQELLREVWGYAESVHSRTVRTTVGRLRAKVEHDDPPTVLLTVPGEGYQLATLPVDEGRPKPPMPLDDFVGRERELAELRRALVEERRRLVVLTGPGGIGKTRLACVWGRTSRDVQFFDLAAATRPEHVVEAVAEHLGVTSEGRTTEGVVGMLAHEAHTSIFDNAEQIEGLGALLVGWLARAPGLRFLVTSRTPLGVPGEMVIEVGPLGEQASAELLVRRFAERGVPLAATDEDVQALAAELELPLAVELAAGWADVLPLPDLRARLHQVLATGDAHRQAPERHRTLHAALDGSLHLLKPELVPVLPQLAAFPATFGLLGAEAVLDTPDVLGALRDLRRAALLQLDAGRYRMLTVLRPWATALQPEAAAAAQQRHVQWVLRHPEAPTADVLQAHDVALRTDASAALTLATRIATGPMSATLKARHLEQTLTGGAAPAHLVHAWAEALCTLGRPDQAVDVLARLGDPDDASHVLLHASALLDAGRPEGVRELLDRAQALAGDDPAERARCALGRVAWLRFRSDPALAEQIGRALELAQLSGDPFLLARARSEQAVLLSEQMEAFDAEQLLLDVVATYAQDGASHRLALAWFRLAKVTGEVQDWSLCRERIDQAAAVARRAGAAGLELQAQSLRVAMAVEGGQIDAATEQLIDEALARLAHMDAPLIEFSYRLFHGLLPAESGDYMRAIERLRRLEYELRPRGATRALTALLLRLGQVELAAGDEAGPVHLREVRRNAEGTWSDRYAALFLALAGDPSALAEVEGWAPDDRDLLVVGLRRMLRGDDPDPTGELTARSSRFRLAARAHGAPS
ncbi:MAG: winged helix-turn-helix domain-containing protein [Myxococcales bacterium]|nr:winged helix-turn-helix domain-containing protein [Myxococcales bacterium]